MIKGSYVSLLLKLPNNVPLPQFYR